MAKQNHGYFIYLLKEKKTRKVIYVGCTLHPMRRLLEHQSYIETNSAPLYQYLRENNFKLYRDIEFHIVEKTNGIDSKQAEELEQFYTLKYSHTVLNVYLGNERDGEYSNKNKRIRCITDGKVYNSVKEILANYEGVTNIYSHLKRGTKLRCGLVFEYVDEKSNAHKTWTIQCLDDDLKFSSIKQCSQHYGVSADILYHGDKSGETFIVNKDGKDIRFRRLK